MTISDKITEYVDNKCLLNQSMPADWIVRYDQLIDIMWIRQCRLIEWLPWSIIIIILESAVQGRERVRTLSVQRPQPHTTIPWREEKDKTVGDKKERADHANRKASALLLKPASPTPLNTGSLRSFQRDTERGTKLLRY